MAVVLAYVDAVPGRLYPLVPTLQELTRRGHRVAIRCGKYEAELLQGMLPIRDGRSRSLDGQGMNARRRRFRVRGVEG